MHLWRTLIASSKAYLLSVTYRGIAFAVEDDLRSSKKHGIVALG